MTEQELFEQTQAAAAQARRKEQVDYAAEIVAMLETPGGLKLQAWISEAYESMAKVDPALFSTIDDNGKLHVSQADLGKYYGIASFIRTMQSFFDEQRSVVHMAALENSTTPESGV